MELVNGTATKNRTRDRKVGARFFADADSAKRKNIYSVLKKIENTDRLLRVVNKWPESEKKKSKITHENTALNAIQPIIQQI